jgi:hypothetical protein
MSSRRAVLLGAAAAVPVAIIATPPALAAMPASFDLADLERSFFKSVVNYEEAMQATSDALDRYEMAEPDRPEAMRVISGRDFWCFGGLAGQCYSRIKANGGYWPSDVIETAHPKPPS